MGGTAAACVAVGLLVVLVFLRSNSRVRSDAAIRRPSAAEGPAEAAKPVRIIPRGRGGPCPRPAGGRRGPGSRAGLGRPLSRAAGGPSARNRPLPRHGWATPPPP